MALNNVTIQGRLTRDPELRRTGSGTAVASFTVAVDRDFASKENGNRETDFIDCVAWRQTGEFIEKYFSKGQMIAVVGRIQTRTWKDKDENNRRTVEIVVDHAYFCGGKNDGGKPDTAKSDAPADTSWVEDAKNAKDADAFDTLDYEDTQLPF